VVGSGCRRVQADEDGSNALDMDKFLAATLGHYRINKEENLVFAFQYLDKDGSGQISIEELKQACLEFGFSTADLPSLFAEVDTNKVGSRAPESPRGPRLSPRLPRLRPPKGPCDLRALCRAGQYVALRGHECCSLSTGGVVQDNMLDYKEFVALMRAASTSSIVGKQSSLGKDKSLTGQIEEDRVSRSMPRRF